MLLSTIVIHFFIYHEISGLRLNSIHKENNETEGSEANIEPIFYVHIPKAGSSIATSIVHLVCGNKVDSHLAILDPGQTQTWQNKCGRNKIRRFKSSHDPLDLKVDLSTVVTMARPAKQRIISGYMHSLHDCPRLQRMKGIQANPPWKIDQIDRQLLIQYAKCVEGCATSMFSGHRCTEERNLHQIQADVPGVVAKIPKMGFVGLTNHWDLTICMWHARFGGECLEAEFANLRPGKYGDFAHDESLLESSFNPVDDAVYEAAAKHFMSDMKKYDVTPKTCAITYCPKMAHLFHKDVDVDHENFTLEGLKNLAWEGRANFNQD